MMQVLRFITVFMVLAGILAGGVFAGEKSENFNDIRFKDSDWSEKLVDILNEGSFILSSDYEFDVKPPPANDSAETKADLDYLVELSKTARDGITLEHIMYENSDKAVWEIFINDGVLVQGNNDKALELLQLADKDMRYFILKYKKKFSRARPNQLRPELVTVFPNPPHPAYPSGHAGQAYLIGLILSKLDEDNKDVYLHFARDIGHRREIAGVHYPMDSAAGRKLAEDLFAKLMENPVFQKKVQDAKDSYIKPDVSKVYLMKED